MESHSEPRRLCAGVKNLFTSHNNTPVKDSTAEDPSAKKPQDDIRLDGKTLVVFEKRQGFYFICKKYT